MLGGESNVFSALKGKMAWNEQRHRLIASNVANVNTPNYRPSDVERPDFAALVRAEQGSNSLVPKRTNDNHIGGSDPTGKVYRETRSSGWEITSSGNEVVAEEQMVKMAENASDYQISITLYSRSLAMFRSVLDRA